MQRMKVVVKDLQEKGTCEYTGKEGEIVVCSLDEQMPDVVLSTQEFFRQLRFMKRQRDKKGNGATGQPSGPKPASHDQK